MGSRIWGSGAITPATLMIMMRTVPFGVKVLGIVVVILLELLVAIAITSRVIVRVMVTKAIIVMSILSVTVIVPVGALRLIFRVEAYG